MSKTFLKLFFDFPSVSRSAHLSARQNWLTLPPKGHASTAKPSTRKMLTKSRAIVMQVVRHSDTASILRLYTEEAGMQSFLVRIPKTKRGSLKLRTFQPLSLLEIEWDLRENETLQRLRSSQVSTPYASLPFHPVKASIALFLSEALNYSLREEEANRSLFAFLEQSLCWLDAADGGYANFHLVLLAQLTILLGFTPNVEAQAGDNIFDMMEGSFTSEVPAHPYYIIGVEAQFIALLLRLRYDTMQRLALTRAERNRAIDIILTYYRLHVPSFPELKSIDVLRALFD